MRQVDVIVPVYNVEKYLKRCLESLLNERCLLKNTECCLLTTAAPTVRRPSVKNMQMRIRSWWSISPKQTVACLTQETMDCSMSTQATCCLSIRMITLSRECLRGCLKKPATVKRRSWNAISFGSIRTEWQKTS